MKMWKIMMNIKQLEPMLLPVSTHSHTQHIYLDLQNGTNLFKQNAVTASLGIHTASFPV